MGKGTSGSIGLRTFAFWFVLLALVAAGVWQQVLRNPGEPNRELMFCSTALACAKWTETMFQQELDEGAEDFYAVSRDGVIVTVEYRLDYSRKDFHDGKVEDGRTLEKWAEDELIAPLRDDACDTYDHQNFINMGGAVVHDYRFADGEPLAKVTINDCSIFMNPFSSK